MERESEAVICAVGDIMYTHRLAAFDSAPHGGHQSSTLTGTPYELLHAASLSIGNLEQPMSDGGAPAEKSVTFRSSPALVPSLRDMGVSAVSLANNHMLDFGTQGLLDTLLALDRCGIAHAGAGKSLEEAVRPAFLRAGELQVAFLSFSCTLPPASAAGPDRPGIAPLRVHQAYWLDPILAEEQPGSAPYVKTWAAAEDVRAAQERVREAAANADYCVVAVHWGVPPLWQPPFQGPLADFQRPLGHALLEAGADVVLGHHPHVVHGIEVWRGKPVVYSLGNFLFHAYAKGHVMPHTRVAPPYSREYAPADLVRQSYLVRLTVRRHRTARVEIIPIELDGNGEPTLARDTAAHILNRTAIMSGQLGTEVKLSDQGRGFIEISACPDIG